MDVIIYFIIISLANNKGALFNLIQLFLFGNKFIKRLLICNLIIFHAMIYFTVLPTPNYLLENIIFFLLLLKCISIINFNMIKIVKSISYTLPFV